MRVILDMADVEITAFKASGPGGRHRNKTMTAIRAKHLPSGIVATAASERSQSQNKAAALAALAAKLAQLAERRVAESRRSARDAKPPAAFGGSAIRTYRLIDGANVTDHRTGYTTTDPRSVLRGAIDGLIRSFLLMRKAV